MPFKKGDFVEIEYTGKLKEDNLIFDTTDEKVAKANNIHNTDAFYGPIVVCVGERQIIKGIDDALEQKDLGTYNILVSAEDGFGKKNPKLLRLMPLSIFRKEKIEPMPGMQVTVDGASGIVKTVTGGRVIIDFNHPLSGRDLEYALKIIRKVLNTEEKVDGLLKMMGLGKLKSDFKENSVALAFPAMIPSQVQDEIQGKIKSLIPEITAVTFQFPTEKKPKAKRKPKEEKPEEKTEGTEKKEGEQKPVEAKEAAEGEKPKETAPEAQPSEAQAQPAEKPPQ